jgi:thiol-disulfide isomerase/thioredoxin
MRLVTSTVQSVLFCLLLAHAEAAAVSAPAATGSSDADKAWNELQQNGQSPQPPEAWQKARPFQEEIEKFKAGEGDRLSKAAKQARDFQTRFPKDDRAEQAGSKEYELLQIASQLGNTNGLARLNAIEEAKLKDPKLSEEERFQIRATAVNRNASAKLSESRAAAFAELEKGARSLIKDFPKRQEPYGMLLSVAGEAESDKARQIAKDLAASSAPNEIKDAANAILKKMELVGKPVPIKFTAVDGRSVDLQKLRGKVVLIDFWATWCGPCVHEVPNVVASYAKLHPKGFEIVGISFDKDKDALVKFVGQQKMTWPQYFDGKQWENDYGKQFGIQSIPSMWLVDKKGNLRDLNGREDLANKVEKLLAETL